MCSLLQLVAVKEKRNHALNSLTGVKGHPVSAQCMNTGGICESLVCIIHCTLGIILVVD